MPNNIYIIKPTGEVSIVLNSLQNFHSVTRKMLIFLNFNRPSPIIITTRYSLTTTTKSISHIFILKITN